MRHEPINFFMILHILFYKVLESYSKIFVDVIFIGGRGEGAYSIEPFFIFYLFNGGEGVELTLFMQFGMISYKVFGFVSFLF